MTAYYNEIDPFAAEWLRMLIQEGHIAPGVVDERDIRDVIPNELSGYTQCHFFAGIGVWSYALRQAGWPDDRPVWTGSCPCQPFSTSGKGKGFADERHLWPDWFWLIEQCRPVTIFGEQVGNKDARSWLDLVFADVEGINYTGGATNTPSAGYGAPHIRERVYWVADTTSAGFPQRAGQEVLISQKQQRLKRLCNDGGMAHTENRGQQVPREQSSHHQPGTEVPLRTKSNTRNYNGVMGNSPRERCGEAGALIPESEERFADASPTIELGNASRKGPQRHAGYENGPARRKEQDRPIAQAGNAGPTNGFWSGAEWVGCSDGKARSFESGSFPVAYGITGRVGKLRGYGNAINAQQAKAVIEAYQEVRSTA